MLGRDVLFAVLRDLSLFVGVFLRKPVSLLFSRLSSSRRLPSPCMSRSCRNFRCRRYRTSFTRSTLASRRRSRDCSPISRSKLRAHLLRMVSCFSIDQVQRYFLVSRNFKSSISLNSIVDGDPIEARKRFTDFVLISRVY